MTVFERLQAEGYISCRVGSGTWVNQVQAISPIRTTNLRPPRYIRRVISGYARPNPLVDLVATDGVRPFSMQARQLSSSRPNSGEVSRPAARTFPSWLQTEDDGHGYRPLRKAIADYLGSSRGVRCSSDQVIVVSGVQQALDLLARLLLKRDDPVWVEDPGYFGAMIAFGNVRAKIIPVAVDEQGLSVSTGLRVCPHAKGAYVTPGHQFPLGMTMSLKRRMSVLKWPLAQERSSSKTITTPNTGSKDFRCLLCKASTKIRT